MGASASVLRSHRCRRDHSCRFSAVPSPQQDQEESHAPRNKVRVPPWDKARNVLNDLVVAVLRNGGAKNKLK